MFSWTWCSCYASIGKTIFKKSNNEPLRIQDWSYNDFTHGCWKQAVGCRMAKIHQIISEGGRFATCESSSRNLLNSRSSLWRVIGPRTPVCVCTSCFSMSLAKAQCFFAAAVELLKPTLQSLTLGTKASGHEMRPVVSWLECCTTQKFSSTID